MTYETISTSKGLSQGYIFDILQDRDGFLWFTTKAGLNRYDGYSFKVYAYNAFDSHSIGSNAALHLFEDSKGRIWVGTEDNGISIFNKKKDWFHRILHYPNDPNSLSGNRANYQITEMADGRFLVNASEKYFDIITIPDDFFDKDVPPTIGHIYKPMDCYNQIIYTDAKKETWFSCDGKQYQFFPNKNKFEFVKDYSLHFNGVINTQEGLWLNDERISEIENNITYPTFTKGILKGEGCFFLKEANGRLWISISNLRQLQVYDISKWQRNQPLDPDKYLIAEDKNVGSMKLLKDRTGLVWVGLNGHGIRKYSFESEKFNHKAKDFSVKKILISRQNEIYLKSWAANKKITATGSLVDNEWVEGNRNIFDYYISKSGDLWLTKRNDAASFVITELEQINLVTKKSKLFKVILEGRYGHDQQLTEDMAGNIWIGGYGGAFAVFNPVTGAAREYSLNIDPSKTMSKDEFVTAIYEDNAGIKWIGTDAGFVKIESKDVLRDAPKITWYRTDLKNENFLNDGHVSSFLDDPFNNNLLWISTKGGGLNLMEKSSGKITHITTAQGLCNDVVYGILPDEMGNIWGSTNNGLFCILANKARSNNFEIRHFTEVAGLQAAEFNTGAFAKFPDGYLAFGGINGINVFNPKEILIDSFAPNIFITKLLVNNKQITPGDKTGLLDQAIEFTRGITLNYMQDEFTLEFSSLDYRAPDQNKYRYQLTGIDKEWVESGNRHTANYVHLPAGKYVFRVQGSNSQGIWSNKVAELTISITPPWWLSWWAYVLYALIIGFAVRSYFKFKVNKARLKTQLNFEQQEAKRIKELDAVKTQLYANITHEFRTPLTVILGMANQLKSDPDKYLEDGVDMIVRNGNNLLNLVNEMLDLSKLEDGKMTLNLINGDIVTFLRYIVEAFQSLAKSQQKQFHFLADTDELMVAYDAEKIRQIITNLLANALKFTPASGNVYVNISQNATANKDKTALVLKIKDTGIGIPENQMEHIFDRFYQIDNSHTRHAEGTGIGLSLTKELVKLMNGTIAVKSPPVGATKGTEFIITIPLTKVANSGVNENTTIAPVNEDGVAKPLEIKSIQYIDDNTNKDNSVPLLLLVEDNIDVVAYTASCLPDYKLSVGKDGQEGFDIAIDIIPDLIITDVMMPFIDGFEMCRKLRQDERTSHIPIIMLTAKADMQSKLEGLEKGADVYLEKPFNKEELLVRIRKLLELRKNLRQYYSKQIGIIIDAEIIPATELKAIGEITEHEFVKKVREIVEANFSNYEFSVEQLCKLVFMSYSQLNRKLEALTGYSPNKFIKLVRLHKAKELLVNPALSIGSIALDCGYIDPGYFARVFKQEYGVTPQEWRVKK